MAETCSRLLARSGSAAAATPPPFQDRRYPAGIAPPQQTRETAGDPKAARRRGDSLPRAPGLRRSLRTTARSPDRWTAPPRRDAPDRPGRRSRISSLRVGLLRTQPSREPLASLV